MLLMLKRVMMAVISDPSVQIVEIDTFSDYIGVVDDPEFPVAEQKNHPAGIEGLL